MTEDKHSADIEETLVMMAETAETLRGKVKNFAPETVEVTEWRYNKSDTWKNCKHEPIPSGVTVELRAVARGLQPRMVELLPSDDVPVPPKKILPQTVTNVTETVNHPLHYNVHPSGVECIEIVEHMNFNLGSAVKYIWRADEKHDAMEDLEKARWYIKREIARRRKLA